MIGIDKRLANVKGVLNLNGGIINGDGTVIVTNCLQEGIMGGDESSYIQTTLVRCVAPNETFNFAVGTANGYSQVTIKGVSGTGIISVKANQGAYSEPAKGLPENRVRRWWQIENPGGGVTSADLYFGYQDSDYIGVEPNFSAYRISGGTAQLLESSRSKAANFVEVLDVTNFSNWTLADVAPPITSVSVGGRITTADGQAIRNVGVTITDESGVARTVRTNNFGYYRFDGVQVGVSYDFTVSNNRYVFDPSSRSILVTDEIAFLDWFAEELNFK